MTAYIKIYNVLEDPWHLEANKRILNKKISKITF